MNLNKKIRKSIRNLTFSLRKMTASSRALPEFLIVGAQKAGTTSLNAYINQHPKIIPSWKKEVHYFDGGLDPNHDNFSMGSSWYRAHFPTSAQLTAKQSKTFEASPSYLFNPLAAERIKRLVPDVKIIIMLRNPAERAISHYYHEKRKGRMNLSLDQALLEEDQIFSNGIGEIDYKSNEFVRRSFKARGIYVDQVKRYFDVFGRGNVHVVDSDSLFTNPKSVLNDVFEFIGIPRYEDVDFSPRNVGMKKSVESDRVYEELKAYFEAHNEKLYDLLGERFAWD
jgi:hypothetical protein